MSDTLQMIMYSMFQIFISFKVFISEIIFYVLAEFIFIYYHYLFNYFYDYDYLFNKVRFIY